MTNKKHHRRRKWKFSFPIKGTSLLLGISLLLFLETFLLNFDKANEVTERLYLLAKAMAPILVIAFILMVLVNLFLRTSKLVKYLGKDSGIKGWLIAIIAGNLSAGTTYFWFPILKEMMENGMRPGLIASFLYNRGIKLVWLPVMALVFGIKYVVILTIITALVSILHGLIIDLFIKKPAETDA